MIRVNSPATDSGHRKFPVGGHGLLVDGQQNARPADNSWLSVAAPGGPKGLSLGVQAEDCAGAPDRLTIDDLGARDCKQRWLVEAASEPLPPRAVPMSLSVVTILVSVYKEFLVSANNAVTIRIW